MMENSFNTLIGRKSIPPGEKIHYLKMYLKGAALEYVEGYFLLSTDCAYQEAMSLLEQRYGHPFIIANTFRDKLETWPSIQGKDPKFLRKFANFLKQCVSAMEATDNLNVLNDERQIKC